MELCKSNMKNSRKANTKKKKKTKKILNRIKKNVRILKLCQEHDKIIVNIM